MDITLEAANLKANHKIAYADAFAAALTLKKRATLITVDKEFEALSDEKNFRVQFI